jgi:hypothetical protein
MTFSMSNAFKGALFFGLIAPPIGSIPFGSAAIVAAIVSGSSNDLVFAVPGALALALFSYLFGAVPALATGLAAGFFRHSARSTPYCIAIGSVAGALTLAFGAATLPLTPNESGVSEIRTLFLMYGFPGIFSGIVTAVLFRRHRVQTTP